ncbi:hypothetical protein D3C85_1520440 [compost metagenome]
MPAGHCFLIRTCSEHDLARVQVMQTAFDWVGVAADGAKILRIDLRSKIVRWHPVAVVRLNNTAVLIDLLSELIGH